MTKPLIIVGAGGFGREVAWLARSLPSEWSIVGFLDDDQSLQNRIVSGLPVLGNIADCSQYSDAWFVVALGSPRVRKLVVRRLDENGSIRYATLIHPSVFPNEYGSIGEGSILAVNSSYSDCTRIGHHCVVNATTCVGHDVVMDDFCTLAGHVGICGNVSLGAGCELGTGAVVVPGIAVGEGSLCCAGSVVANPVRANAVVAGNPARRVKDLPPF